MTDRLITRRHFVATSGVTAATLAAVTSTRAATGVGDEFTYEINRTDEEWRAMLSDAEHKILREGDTELPRTSDLWNEEREGTYRCKGCGLLTYTSNWKVPLDKGWVFFAHAEPNSVLMDIDGPQQAYGMNPNGIANLIEVHCRRCGSHLGHILKVDGLVVHCINGQALTFEPAEA
ncbi:MAG: peptide-methionine (R)-S-oxide reductase [Pseudomonadota bacterium]